MSTPDAGTPTPPDWDELNETMEKIAKKLGFKSGQQMGRALNDHFLETCQDIDQLRRFAIAISKVARHQTDELTALRAAHEADEQELGATMKVLGQALNPTAELTVGGVLEMARSLVERYEAAQAEIAALKRGEYICQKCGLRKDGEYEKEDF